MYFSILLSGIDKILRSSSPTKCFSTTPGDCIWPDELILARTDFFIKPMKTLSLTIFVLLASFGLSLAEESLDSSLTIKAQDQLTSLTPVANPIAITVNKEFQVSNSMVKQTSVEEITYNRIASDWVTVFGSMNTGNNIVVTLELGGEKRAYANVRSLINVGSLVLFSYKKNDTERYVAVRSDNISCVEEVK